MHVVGARRALLVPALSTLLVLVGCRLLVADPAVEVTPSPARLTSPAAPRPTNGASYAVPRATVRLANGQEVELLAGTLAYAASYTGRSDDLTLITGETILFSGMDGFEIVDIARAPTTVIKARILRSGGEEITETLQSESYLRGSTSRAPFQVGIAEVRSVRFHR